MVDIVHLYFNKKIKKLNFWILFHIIILCKVPPLYFIYLGFYVTFNTVQVISRRVVGRAEETSTYSSSGFCTVNCRPTASNYQLSHLRDVPGTEPRSQRWQARVLPLCHRGPLLPCKNVVRKVLCGQRSRG